MTSGHRAGTAWWRDAVFYEIYVRSFADGNGDGVGDLPGIRSRLPYLRSLGVDAIWITPFYVSPMADHGYDVADPRAVDPRFGDLADFVALVTEAHEVGLKVTVDLVPNHVSDRHPWFIAALAAGPGSPERARFHFRPSRGRDGSAPPNNWPSVFGGPAWERVEDGEWYLHLFAPEQPDLNWANPEVAADLDATMRFWLDRGADGFRIDVAHGMAKDPGLPDLDPATALGLLANGGAEDTRFDNDRVHEIHRGIRRTLEDYPGSMAVGEVWVRDPKRLSRYSRPNELHLAFDFGLVECGWDAGEIRASVTRSLATVARTGAPACWVLSNHDVDRHVTRFGGGELGVRRGKAATLLQLALPGVVYLYNGEELGLPNVELPDAVLQDPVWQRSGHTERGRDGERVPMPWAGDAAPYGFSTGASTWLPMPAGWRALTVAAQLDDTGSTLTFYRRALTLRRAHPAISGPDVRWLAGNSASTVAFARPGGLICVLNTGDTPVALPAGVPLLSSVPLVGGMLPANAAVWLDSSRGRPAAQ